MATAFVVDGAYFLRRLRWAFPHIDHEDPEQVVEALWQMVRWHMHEVPAFLRDKAAGLHSAESPELYRIFFYDCPPLTKKMHLPISRRAIDLSKTPAAKLRIAIHRELNESRKVAVRLGRLNDASDWRLTTDAVKRLRSGQVRELIDEDFEIDTKQKGVDMKLGLDVATMALKRQVSQIVLVAGDADFVPAAKLARREGIDVVLQTMGQDAPHDLHVNVDDVRSYREDRKKQ